MKDVLIPELMSSEEGQHDDDGKRFFKVKKPEWRKKKYQRLLDVIDKAYMDNATPRSKEQMVVRVDGSPSKRAKPTGKNEIVNSFL